MTGYDFTALGCKYMESQSLRADQGSADVSWRRLGEVMLKECRNPSVLIRALPTMPCWASTYGRIREVAIPPC